MTTPNIDAAMSADEINRKLANNLAYLHLMCALVPGEFNISQPVMNEIFQDVKNFYLNVTEQTLLTKGQKITKTFESLISYYRDLVPPKKPLEIIASDFNDLCAERDDIYSFGIEFEWLDKRIDCSKIGLPGEIPWQTRVGIGSHAGKIEIEESFLLRDAFYLFVNAEDSFTKMHERAKEINELDRKTTSSDMKNLSYGNFDVATYSRLTMVSMFSFVEAFVNSVGYDYYLRNKDYLSPIEIETLKGKKGRWYLKTEDKIEKFQKIIRDDNQSPIIISDKAQREEPFISFINKIKPIRDSSVHYSPNKESIWRRPQDWLESAKSSTQLCLSVAREFWAACYPNRGMPFYLFKLNYDRLIDEANNRLHSKDSFLNVPILDQK